MGGSGKKFRKRVARAEVEEANTLNKIREQLGKDINEIISDREAALLKTQNIIDETQESIIQKFNRLGLSGKEILDLAKETQDISQQNILDDIIESSIFQQEKLASGFEGSIDELRNTRQDIIEDFESSGAIEASKRAIQFQNILQGIASPEEKADFESKFGSADLNNPILSLAAKSLDKRERELDLFQRASGGRRSGAGLEEFTSLTAEEAGRQFQRLGQTAERGIGVTRDLAQARGIGGTAIAQSQQDLARRQSELDQRKVDLQSQTQQLFSGRDLSIQGERLRTEEEATTALVDVLQKTGISKAQIQATSAALTSQEKTALARDLANLNIGQARNLFQSRVAQAQAKKDASGILPVAGTVAGGIVGAYFGGPAGAAGGAAIGGGLGQLAQGSFGSQGQQQGGGQGRVLTGVTTALGSLGGSGGTGANTGGTFQFAPANQNVGTQNAGLFGSLPGA